MNYSDAEIDRAAFEKWALSEGFYIDHAEDSAGAANHYEYINTQRLWQGWQAKTSSLGTGDAVDARQKLPAGWNIEVRENAGVKALCIFGPIGCFAVDGTTDFPSMIRTEIIESLQAALAKGNDHG